MLPENWVRKLVLTKIAKNSVSKNWVKNLVLAENWVRKLGKIPRAVKLETPNGITYDVRHHM